MTTAPEDSHTPGDRHHTVLPEPEGLPFGTPASVDDWEHDEADDDPTG